MAARLPLTLVMVSYNKADTIGLSIESAATGTTPPDLIVVSDDGSNDGTPDVAEATAAKHGIPIRIIRHQRVGRYRIQTMRNTCAQNALDDGIVFLSDSDCIFGPHTVETHIRIHEQHHPAIGTGPRFEYLDGASGPFTTTFTTLEFAHFSEGGLHCVPVGANYSFLKSTWNRLGGFDRAYDGSYGMEEFEFSRRAETIGVRCVADPAGYVFHIPHETVFGNRNAFRNIGVFDSTFETNHIDLERQYIVDHVVPSYWSGRRKTPLVGLDACPLDVFGAPDGFRPPLHLQLMRTLEPLITPARRITEKRKRGDVRALRQLLDRMDEKLLASASAVNIYQQDLRWILRQFDSMPEIVQRLEHWLVGAEHVENQNPEAAQARSAGWVGSAAMHA